LSMNFIGFELTSDALAVTRGAAVIEREVRHADGSHYLVRVMPYRTKQNLIDGVVVTFSDITGRKLAEEEIKGLNERLKRQVTDIDSVNKELEAFSYSVSHDLRAPLRHLSGFVELLKKRLREVDCPDAKTGDYMDMIYMASKKMGMLIDDLLNFARLGRTEMQIRKINFNTLVREVVSEIRDDQKERKIEWEIDELPDVVGDRSLLRLVMVNLLSNAVKFTNSRPQAEIKIGCKDEGDKIIFSVKDNGAGFDMKYADKIFGVFQRLHSHDEFEGTGIGLANVQRIIARHGGRVWAEGTVGRGAAFYFSLPKIRET
ncbi:MAG TPA: ATP-binding protein, partial [Dissulfurispiraceae bacterium]|nr:ATP-binding protein [Dissulfurispiraceae bacterium]